MIKNYILPAFILTVLLQLAVPAKMIYDSEMTHRHGTEYKFKTTPVDPIDPFRGKYITLNYDLSSIASVDTTFKQGDRIYVVLKKDIRGFASADALLHEKPGTGKDYLIAEVNHNYGGRVHIELPFDRFYMEESKAPEAEAAYAKNSRNKSLPAYALVAVKDGNAVVKDVIINEVPIREYILKQRKSPKN